MDDAQGDAQGAPRACCGRYRWRPRGRHGGRAVLVPRRTPRRRSRWHRFEEDCGRDAGAIRGNQRHSEVIRGNHRQSEAIRGTPRHSEAFRGIPSYCILTCARDAGAIGSLTAPRPDLEPLPPPQAWRHTPGRVKVLPAVKRAPRPRRPTGTNLMRDAIRGHHRSSEAIRGGQPARTSASGRS